MLPSIFTAQPRNVRQDMVAYEVNATIQQMISTLKDDEAFSFAHAMYDEMVDFPLSEHRAASALPFGTIFSPWRQWILMATSSSTGWRRWS